MKPKRLLIVSHGFAPYNMTGILRMIKFVKLLSRWNWQCAVITAKNITDLPRDNRLLDELPPETRIVRTASFEANDLVPASLRKKALQPRPSTASASTGRPSFTLRAGKLFRQCVDFVFFPDDFCVWALLVKKEADRLVEEFHPDIVLSTSPPQTDHLVARRLHKKYGLPWVADFRDEWTQNPFKVFPTKIHKALHRHVERGVLHDASAVISISEPITAKLASLLPESERNKFHTIYNGYDEDDFAGAPRPLFQQFTITYTGNFYGHRNPTSFLLAIQKLLRSKEIPIHDIRILFIGMSSYMPDPRLDMELLRRVLDIRPSVAHREATAIMRQSSALLLVISALSGIGSLTAKIFEYLASGRPILALAPQGDASDIINNAHAGVVVDPDDVNKIADEIKKMYTAWVRGELLQTASSSSVQQYSRLHQTRRLHEILSSLIHPG